MKIASFNIRCIWDGVDGKQSFIYRKEFVVAKIRKEKPDVIGFQEITEEIFDYLQKALPEYCFFGHGRLEDFTGEGVYTATLKESIKLNEMELFWISDTPYVPGSRLKGQSNCPRTCVRTTLLYKNKLVCVYNLHLDHLAGADELRKKEIEIVFEDLEKQMKKYEIPTFILGDFNDTPDSGCIKYVNQKGFKDLCFYSGFTFHNFEGDAYGQQSKIDYIFCDIENAEKLVKTEKWTDIKNGLYLSDHYPIMAEIKL